MSGKKILSMMVAISLISVPCIKANANFPGSGNSTPTWSGATEITSSTITNSQTYTSNTADQNAVLIKTDGTVTLTNPTVTKSGGTSAGDEYSFYGTNSAVICKGGGSTIINGGTVTTDAEGANGIFSYGSNSGQTNAEGDGTTVTISNTTIKTTGNGSGGIMTTFGGTTVAKNLKVTTTGGSSAPIRTDRGGGWVTVSGGTYSSSGTGSPVIYSTADVKVSDAILISQASEGTCIEGTGSISLTNCNLTATNNKLNGNATFYDTIMIYQSQSGDASSGTSCFTMTGGTLTSNVGHTFHVTNTNAIITLSDVAITNSADGILLSVCDDGWSGASNIATLNASAQALEGGVLVGSDSTLVMNISNSSTFDGYTSGSITNGKGSVVSSSIGTLNMTVGSGCTWNLTKDSYVSSLVNNGTINTNGHNLYVNGKKYDPATGTTENTTVVTTTTKTIKNGLKITTVDSDGNKIKLEITKKAKKYVTYSLVNAGTNSVVVPDTVSINGIDYKVTGISKNGFVKGKSKITAVTLGSNIKTIGKNAFKGCKKLTSLTFSKCKVTSIGENAFKMVNKKIVFTVDSSKSKFKKLKKLIKSAGAPAKASYKRV